MRQKGPDQPGIFGRCAREGCGGGIPEQVRGHPDASQMLGDLSDPFPEVAGLIGGTAVVDPEQAMRLSAA